MTGDIEHRIRALEHHPINECIETNPEQYSLWLLANFDGELKDPQLSQNRETQRHIGKIAELLSQNYDTTLHQLRERHGDYYQNRHDRLREQLQETRTDRFVIYATASWSYLDKLKEAINENLGMNPDSIGMEDIRSMEAIYLSLRNAHTMASKYGYTLDGPGSAQ